MPSALQQKEPINWANRSSGTTAKLNAATFARSTFVVVGDQGTILTSPDGMTWTKRNSGTTNNLLAVGKLTIKGKFHLKTLPLAAVWEYTAEWIPMVREIGLLDVLRC